MTNRKKWYRHALNTAQSGQPFKGHEAPKFGHAPGGDALQMHEPLLVIVQMLGSVIAASCHVG